MVDTSNQAKSIFLEAIEKLAPAQWPAFLDEICAEDPALRARVERLLAAQAQLGSFHEAQSLGMVPTASQPITESPGSVVGPYKLKEQIGEGGMGLVYVAEQHHPVRRKVALKLIKPGMDTRQVIARFEAERQALALMNHPNIAKVFDGGETASGRPYFVMELVRGVPITEYCDEYRLTPRARLELFGQVCAAIQHAHQKGIIHRDIKPSNVMIASHDGTPIVKIIDFGVAKAIGQQLTDKSVYTQFTQFVGTPLYMSPEQAGQSSLDIDTRTDVYALGVLLYELLTGTTPFDKELLSKASYDEIRRVIREEEPPKPSTRMSTLNDLAGATLTGQRQMSPRELSLLLRGELDWIVMKALEKDRNRRYESASAFAADVERYLIDEPVQACPPSRRYLWGKLVRRRRRGLLMAAALVGAAMLCVAAASWVAIDRSLRRTEQEIQRIATERAVTEDLTEADNGLKLEQYDKVQKALERAQVRVQGAGHDALVAQVEQRWRDMAMVNELEEARLLFTTSFSNWLNASHFESPKKAGDAFSAAFVRYGLKIGPDDVEETAHRVRASAIANQLVLALDHWAMIASRWPFQEVRRLRAIASLADNDPWRQRLRDPAVVGDVSALLEIAHEEGLYQRSPNSLLLLTILLDDGKFRDQDLRKKIKVAQRMILRKAQLHYPGDFWINFALSRHMSSYVTPLPLEPSDRAEALVFLRVAVALQPRNHYLHFILGQELSWHGMWNDAEIVLRRAILYNAKNASIHHELAKVLLRQDRLTQAQAAIQDAIKLSASSERTEAQAAIQDATKYSPSSDRYVTLGDILLAQKDVGGAEHAYRQAAAFNLTSKLKLGAFLRDQQKWPDAIEVYRGIVDRPLPKTFKDNGFIDIRHSVAKAHCGIAIAYERMGQFNESLACYELGHEIGTSTKPFGTSLEPTQEQIRKARQFVRLDAELPKYIRGQLTPADNTERLDLAELCGHPSRRYYAAATRFYVDAFEHDPGLEGNLQTGRRYEAACAAAMAGCGRGEDAAALEPQERARLRRQALDWLRAHVVEWSSIPSKNPLSGFATGMRMQQVQSDSHFDGLRGEASLAKLPAVESQEWRALWNVEFETLKKHVAETRAKNKEKTKAEQAKVQSAP